MADLFPPAGLVMPKPDWGFDQTPDADVNIVRLGDGYESREPTGLNHITESYSPKWSSLEPAIGEQAYAFLKPRLKWKSVLWAHPVSGVMLKVVPEECSLTYDDWGNAVLDVRFRQDPNPE